MHSITHSLAHRGPGASRARSRWQPYSCNALNTTTSPTLSRSPYPYVNTPSSAISSSSSSSAYISPAILTSARPAQPCTPAKPTPTTSGPSRDHKYKYVAGLIKPSNRYAIFGSLKISLSCSARRRRLRPIRLRRASNIALSRNLSSNIPSAMCNSPPQSHPQLDHLRFRPLQSQRRLR
ncbi:hypothetical protein BDW22DRAFT_1073102 [Trametopsis cervina]|nr:hypothetical protein BDW22DRAFT_1073102 [Trametopsis cervina]